LDADGDFVPDCRDTCVDGDEDGVGNGNLGNDGCDIPDTDLNDGAPHTCADTDHDTCDDCANGSWDPSSDGDDNDSDGVCNAGDPAVGNPNRCGDWDRDSCDDCSVAGHWDPANDGTDEDGDGWCADGDCSDEYASCTTDCADLDSDIMPDCADDCFDVDHDDYGVGVGCLGADCKDNDAACGADCTACPPAALVLTTPAGAVPVCDTANMSIDLDELSGAAVQLSCESSVVKLNGPIGFELGANPWDIWSDHTDSVMWWPWSDDVNNCDTSGHFAYFNATGGTESLKLGVPFNATGWQNLAITFDVQYFNAPPAGENLKVLFCCGPGCTPKQVGFVCNAADDTQPHACEGGTDACQPGKSISLPPAANNCAALMIQFEFLSSSTTGGQVGIDNVALSGDLRFDPVTETSVPGDYETSATSCLIRAIDVTCTWDDGINEPKSAGSPVWFTN
jgi:hypothetical protein